MDELDQKIKSNNVFLQTQAVSLLQEKVVEDAKGSQLLDSVEVKKLWNIVNTGTVKEVRLASEVICRLVTGGQLPAPATLQNFLIAIISAKSPGALIGAVTNIMLVLCETSEAASSEDGSHKSVEFPFTGPPSGPLHPYVVILRRKPELLEAILHEVDYLINFGSERFQSVMLDFVRPLCTYCLCLTDSFTSYTKSLLDFLRRIYQSGFSYQVSSYLIRVVSLIKVTSVSHVKRKLMLLCLLTELSTQDKVVPLQNALLPCLIYVLPFALDYDLSAHPLESCISSLTELLDHGCDITICTLADVLPRTSGTLQVVLLRLATKLLSYNDGNPLIGARLLPSLLQLLSDSCSAVPGLTTVAGMLVSIIQNTSSVISSNIQLAGNEYWEHLQCTSPELASYLPAIDFCNHIARNPESASEWLKKLASTTGQISGFHYTIVTAIVLYQNSTPSSLQQAMKVLEREVVKCESLSLEIFPMVLYRLGREQDANVKLTLLYLLPSLAVNKMSLVLVLKTLLALWSSAMLKPLILRLMYELWNVKPRVYPYLMQLISDKSANSRDVQVSRAYVVYCICKSKPSQHGEELVPILSNFLNESKGEEGCAQAVIALDGIIELCSASVIDLRTTWKVISPKLLKDKRPEVLAKLCNLLSLVPKQDIHSSEYEIFSQNILKVLWTWVAESSSLIVVEAAYKALAQFALSSFRLTSLPEYAKKGLKMPASMITTPLDATKNPEDVLTYVPAEVWVKLAVGCPKDHMDCVESFLSGLVQKEVASLPKSIYLSATQEAKRKGAKRSEGQPEPSSWRFMADSSVLRALTDFLMRLPQLVTETPDESSRRDLLCAAKMITSSLSQSLNRPYPALDWVFLEALLEMENLCLIQGLPAGCLRNIRENVVSIAARQSSKSASASAFITKWLASGTLSPEDELLIFFLLDHIGRGLPPALISPFLSCTFERRFGDREHLIRLLKAFKPHLTSDFIHDSNRNILSNCIENLNDKMDPTDEELYAVYKSCVADLSIKHIERLTSPSLWWEITDEKLYRATVLRCYVASHDPEESALPWLNDMVDSAAVLPGERSHFLRVMAETFICRNNVKEGTAWLLQLIGRLLEHLKADSADNLVVAHEQQQRVVFYMDLLVTGVLVWSGVWSVLSLNVLTSSHRTREALIPAALITLSKQADWQSFLSQLLTWLVSNHLKLSELLNERYHLHRLILYLALLLSQLPQTAWNRMITFLL